MRAEFTLNEIEEEWVAQLCREFDPEQFIAPWIREKGDPKDWEAYLRIERLGLRDNVVIATLVGGVLEHIGNPWGVLPGYDWAQDRKIRSQIFYGLAQELTRIRPEDKADVLNGYRVHDSLSTEESNRLGDAMYEACEAACRRALLLDEEQQPA